MSVILRSGPDASPRGPASPVARAELGVRCAGYTPFGLLVFEATPSDCQTGVAAAGIEGVVGLGKQ